METRVRKREREREKGYGWRGERHKGGNAGDKRGAGKEEIYIECNGNIKWEKGEIEER